MSDYTPSAAEVKVLREATSAGMMDCKRALVETAGDHDAAVTLLRERGIAKQATRADRSTKEGVVDAYIHGNGRIGVLVEIGCETDFVANTPSFREFAHEVALQISALPGTRWVRREDVPAELVQAEIDIYKAQAADKPEQVQKRIAEGKLGKWYEGVVLLEQPWIRDGDRTIEQLRAELSVATGENVEVKRFARFERGA
jgi:elongation factor Ts